MRFYNAKIILVASLLVVGIFTNPAHAGTNTNCISVQNGRSSLSSSTLALSADLYWNCTDAPMSGGVIYTITEDSFANCTGPSYANKATTYTRTYAGVVSCTVNTINSGRAGATTSTLRIWSSYDFSTQYITIYHQQIPYPTTPTPVPIPTPTFNPKPTPTIAIPTPSTQSQNSNPGSVMQVKQYCEQGSLENIWHCVQAPIWEYSICSNLIKGTLQKYQNGKWINISSFKAVKNSAYCSNVKFPYYIQNIREEEINIGTYKYRFSFPPQSNKVGYTYEFTLRALMGEVGKNAL